MGEKPVLLIADDNEDVVQLLKVYLRPLDCEILVARDGEEALTIAQSRLPDVVLLDVMMPKHSGWEVCQTLKAVQRTSHMAVVLVTARGDVKDRLTGLQLGADDYLVKPFDRDQVVKRIGALLQRRRTAREAEPETPVRAAEMLLIDRATGLPTVPMVLDRLKEILIDAMRQQSPQMQQGQIGFFVGAARIDYNPQIRLERQVYQGMQIAAAAVRDAEQQRKKQLPRELRDIIRRKRVTTLFQPIVRAREGTVFGYEILTRGPHHSSFRNSDMLFSFAREAKLAWELEAISLECALRRLRSFDLGDRKFLLNLEAEMFSESEFRIHEVVSFFSEHRGHFVFELTERAAIEDYHAFRRLLDEFRSKGIEVAIDDAGSGYASLEAIAALSPDYLKVTKGLVSTLAREPIKQDLGKLLVELAGKINAKTIAEGIETPEEYETCRELGIDLLQGYFLAHPQEQLRV